MHRGIGTLVLGAIILLGLGSLVAPLVAPAAPFDIGWGTPSPIGGPRDFRIYSPSAAMGSDGSAIAAWVEDEGYGTPQRIFVRHLSPSTDWGTPFKLAEGAQSEAHQPDVAIGPNGIAMVVWDAGDDILASRFLPGTAWETPTVIDFGSASGYQPSVAMDGQGNAVAIWAQTDPDSPTNPHIYANRFVTNSGWGTPTQIDSGGWTYAGVPVLAMNESGSAIAVWTQSGGIHANRFLPPEGWEGPSFVHPGLNNPYNVELAMGGNGTAVVVWQERDGEGSRAYASRFVPGVGWSTATIIDAGVADAFRPHAAMDASGNATVVWLQREGSSDGVYARRFVPSDGWGPATAIGAGLGYATDPEIAMDAYGRAIAVWRQQDIGGWRVYSNHFVPSEGWTGSAPLDFQEDGGWPRVAMASDGQAVVLWLRAVEDYEYDRAYARRYAPEDGWKPAVTLDRGPRIPLWPSLAMNLRGNATAVWLERYQGNFDNSFGISANRFSPAMGWGVEGSIGIVTNPLGHSPLEVAMDDAGNALVVWAGFGDSSVWATAYDVTSENWSNPEPIGESLAGLSSPPRIAMDAKGNGIVAWSQRDGTTSLAYASHYAPNGGWGPPTLIDPDLGEAQVSDIAVDLDGNAIVVLVHRDGTILRAYASRYVAGEGWGPASPIDAGERDVWARFRGVPELEVAMDGAGNAIAIWSERFDSDSPSYISYNRFNPGAGWGMASVLAEDASNPRFAVGLDGSAIVAWRQVEGDRNRILAKRFDPSAGWETVSPISASPTDARPFVLAVTVDPHGGALAAWVQSDGTSSTVLYNRFVPSVGWAAPIAIGGAMAPTTMMTDGSGNAIAAWGQAGRIYANRFIGGTGTPHLTVTSPTSSLTNSSLVTLAGTTSPGVDVSVNGEPVPVGLLGSFALTVTLPDGTHVFNVDARNAEGITNSAVVEITVDTAAPTLSFTSPAHNDTTDSPTLTVTGTTEPDARLVVNGLVVEVAQDGTFAFDLSLSPGANVITATSMDAAGNQATSSVTVHYRPALVAPIWLVGALFAAVVGLTLLHFAPGLLGRFLGKRGAATQPTETGRRWPTTPAGHPLRLITKERILLHLLGFTGGSEGREVLPEQTQRGIADAVGVDLRHLAQYVRPLIEGGLALEETKRVKGMLQRRKVLALTQKGSSRAREIRERIQSVVVRVKDSSGIRETPLEELFSTAHVSRTLLDIVYEVTKTGTVNIRE